MKAIILCKRLNVSLRSIVRAGNDIGVRVEYDPNFKIHNNDAANIFTQIENNYWKYISVTN